MRHADDLPHGRKIGHWHFDYKLAFGEQWFPFLGTPGLATSAAYTTGQAIVPAAASGMPPLTFPMATLGVGGRLSTPSRNVPSLLP